MVAGDFDSLYDVTVGYGDTIPQDEAAILKGQFPSEIHFHIKRYTKDSIPSEDEG